MIKRIINILIKPKEEWENISKENLTQKEIFLKYSCLLALIPAISRIIELSIVGISTNYFGLIFNKKYDIINSVLYAVSGYFLSLLCIYLAAKVSCIMAKFFNANLDFLNSLKVITFSLVPFWLSSIFVVYQPLNYLLILSLYGSFLMFWGLKIVMHVPQKNVFTFLMVNLIVLFVLFFIAGMVSDRILDFSHVSGSGLPKELLNKFN
jgi:hypothetical protein